MLIYRFLDKNAALSTIKERALRISRICSLNDPFEFLCVDISDREFRRGMLKAKAKLNEMHGLICFSKNWSSPLLWGHYADKHRGLCLAFRASSKDTRFNQVNYTAKRLPMPTGPSPEFARQLLFTKSKHWEYEQEVRLYATLNTERDGHYYVGLSDTLKLSKVIIGSESDTTKKELEDALGQLKNEVEIVKARPAFKEFRVVRNLKEDKYP